METTHSTPAVTRYIGNCQICEGDQKLHNGRMVHHGYQRPGDGAIRGDCPGVGHVPYEVSCELVKSYRTIVEGQLVRQTEHLANLRTGKVTHITEIRLRGERFETIAGVTELSRWEGAVSHEIRETQTGIYYSEKEIVRCTRRIDAWKPTPIRTVEEEKIKAQSEVAARKAEREAARAARDAKKAASKARQEALQAKRTTIRKDFEAKFRALAAGTWFSSFQAVPLADRQKEARGILRELDKSKYRSWLHKWDLECQDAFIALGLAEYDGMNGRGRPYLRWL
jgi:hypothetical protein